MRRLVLRCGQVRPCPVYFCILTLIVVVWAFPGHAASPGPKNVTLSVALESAAKPGSTVWVAVRQIIRPNWHTYWQNPGTAGLPTNINWILPPGVTAGAIQWPTPERFENGGIVDYGYRDQATLLIPLSIRSDAVIDATPAQMHLTWLVCAEMCIPEETDVTIDLRTPSGAPELFSKARTALPMSFKGTARAFYDDRSLSLVLEDTVFAGAKPELVQLFPAVDGAIDYPSMQHVRVIGNKLTLTVARPLQAQMITELTGVLSLDRTHSLEVTAMARPMAETSAAIEDVGVPGVMSILNSVLFAFLGGLILNLMPCVLPVLSMKALALSQSGGDAHVLRRDGTLYFLGVLAAFGSMAGALLLFKAGGAAIGWGFQLQSPVFVFWLALLMSAIGLNLIGVFEVPLSLAGLGENLVHSAGGRGAFFTGVLAALVASPCTAPFMGAALGYALTQPNIVALSIFLSLAIGFALPMTGLAFTPSLARVIPKPGPWMSRFKEFLAFPMFATAIWLTWVFNQQTGTSSLVLALSIAGGLAFVLWLLPLFTPPVRKVVGLAGCAGLFALSFHLDGAQAEASNGMWAPWSAKATDEARQAGNPVLVDFSAAWCVTCLVNERLALNSPQVSARLAKDHVVTLRADWTRQDAAITEELTRYSRSGVPLYLLYPADPAHEAAVLPQILSPALVLKALDGLGSVHAIQRPDGPN